MSKVTSDASNFWTEADYLALDETSDRVELVDGSLWVTPSAGNAHQGMSSLLYIALRSAARAAGLRALEAPYVRLAPGCIVIPDLAVGRLSRVGNLNDAADVALVCEITSPSNAARDREQKRLLYAAAKIPLYLRIEPELSHGEDITVHLLRLDNDRYVEDSTAKPGGTLHCDFPFSFDIRVADLLDY